MYDYLTEFRVPFLETPVQEAPFVEAPFLEAAIENYLLHAAAEIFNSQSWLWLPRFQGAI